jgi:hypothetical protein
MATAKILTVATDVQKAIFEQVLRQEIATGFWKNGRPADHADSWKGVEVVVGSQFGPSGFTVPRNYNFVNPDFYEKSGVKDRILKAAQSVDANVTEKQVKKQLINLNLIVGGRIKEQGGEITKLPRGRKPDQTVAAPKTSSKTSKATVRRAAAVIQSEEETTS